MGYKLNLEWLNKQSEILKSRSIRTSSFSEIRWFSIDRANGSVIRILPPGPDPDMPPYVPHGDVAMPVYNHSFKNMTEKYRCLRLTHGTECAICDALFELREWFRSSDVDESTRKVILEGHMLRGRAYTNVIDRDSKRYMTVDGQVVENPSDAVIESSRLIPVTMVAGLPMTVYEWLIMQCRNENKIKDPLDEFNGLDISIVAKGEGRDTRYSVSFLPDRRPVHHDVELTRAVLRNMYNIADIFKEPSGPAKDKIVAKGMLLRSMVGRTVSDEGGTGSDGMSFQEAAGTAKEDYPVVCYTHHLKQKKCMICPYEIPCKGETDKLKAIGKRSDEINKKFHESLAAN